MKKENGKNEVETSNLKNKSEEIKESVSETKNSKGQPLGDENNQEVSNPETVQNENEKLSKKIKSDSTKGPDEDMEETENTSSTELDGEYIIPVIKESLKRKMETSTDEFSSYFSKKRREIKEKIQKGKVKTKKEGLERKSGNNIQQEIDSNNKRFILRESKLINKAAKSLVFNGRTKDNSGKEKLESIKKVIKSKSQKDVLKKSGQRVDRDSTLFVISTLRRLVDEERFVNADAETEGIFSIPGKKSSKIKTPLTRSRVTEIKNRKTGTRHPKPDKRIFINQLGEEEYNLNKKVKKAEEIYKTYHEVWE